MEAFFQVEELVGKACEYLTPDEISRLLIAKRLSHEFRESLWKSFVVDRSELLPSQVSRFNLQGPASSFAKLGTSLCSVIQQRQVYSIPFIVAGFSSVDREEENPSNILEESICHTLYKMHRTIIAGRRAQYLHCNCSGQTPCYWSSSGSRSEDSNEFIDFAPDFRALEKKLSIPASPGNMNEPNSAIIIIGFSITPYCSFFQPDQPSYAPKFARLQIVASSGPDAAVLWQSESKSVLNIFEQINFSLNQPVLLPENASLRLFMEGKQQRQTVENFTDYYTCLCNFKAFGIVLPRWRISARNYFAADGDQAICLDIRQLAPSTTPPDEASQQTSASAPENSTSLFESILSMFTLQHNITPPPRPAPEVPNSIQTRLRKLFTASKSS